MSSDYSDDQYRADYESRYPQFSDYQLSDEMIAEHKWDRPARSRSAGTYESKYQTEQLGIPAYLGCNCGKCPESAWPRQLPMRKCTIDERERAMREADALRCPRPQAPSVAGGSVAGGSVTGVESMIGGPVDMNTMMLLVMFILIILVCVCMKSVIEIKAQLKNLKHNMTKE
jgi:hypothetical protein